MVLSSLVVIRISVSMPSFLRLHASLDLQLGRLPGLEVMSGPGQESVPQGIFLAGREGDPISGTTPRPAWALDGSFLVFRYLFQLVPEFNEFLRKNPIIAPGLSPEEGSEFLGARLIGRWKSGE